MKKINDKSRVSKLNRKMKKMRKKSYLTNDSLNNFNSPEVEITTERNPNFLVYGTKKSNPLVKT